MYKYIEKDERFRDLQSDCAKNNYMRIMHDLDNVTLPNIKTSPYYSLTTRTLNQKKFDSYVQYFLNKVFLDENTNKLARELATNRLELDFKGYPYGFTSNDTSLAHIISIEGCKYFISPLIAIHEITHAISFINKVQPPKQYEEVLSICNEIKAVREMDETIQSEWLFNKIMQRLKYRIYIKDLSDEAIINFQPNEDLYFQCYFRILNFVYALRLYELYTIFPEEINRCVDSVLKNESNISDLLEKCHISLENEDTILAFEKIILEYEQLVNKYYNQDKSIKQ